MAYWSKERLSGAPPWIDDLYSINAKVSEADLPDWQKQGLALDKKPMLRQMLQSMLADAVIWLPIWFPALPSPASLSNSASTARASPIPNPLRPSRSA